MMRAYFLVALIACTGLHLQAQTTLVKGYPALWQEVDSLIMAGLPLSAKEKVLEGLSHAKRDGATWQQLNAIRYLTRLEQSLEEEEGTSRNVLQTFLAEINRDIPRSPVISEKKAMQSIAASWLADWYLQYFERHRYALDQNSPINASATLPLSGWSASMLLDTIQHWYVFSLRSPEALQIPTDSLSLLLSEYSPQGVQVQPVLFDLLASKALTFLSRTEELRETSPQDSLFYSEKLFGPAIEFATQSDGSPNSSEPHIQTYLLFRNSLSQAMQSGRKAARDYWDLQRLQWALSVSSYRNKKDAYLTALNHLLQQSEDTDYYATIAYTKAKFLLELPDAGSFATEADSLCQRGVDAYPLSPGARLCRALLYELRQHQLSLQVQAVVPVTIPFRMRLDLKHGHAVTGKIFQINNTAFQSISTDREANNLFMPAPETKPVFTFAFTGVHKNISGDTTLFIEIPGLPAGKYLVMVSPQQSQNKPSATALFQVSNIAWTSFVREEKTEIQFLHRVNGKPMPAVIAQLYSREYNMDSRQFESVWLSRQKADKKGRLAVALPSGKTCVLTAIRGKDTLLLDETLFKPYVQPEFSRKKITIMSDRAIYRPGQTVFYKGILYDENRDGIPSIVPSEKLKLEWTDPNGQVLSSKEITTGEFGSFSGQMVLPFGRLTGTFTLVVTGNEVYVPYSIQVEEYRRPAFYVEAMPYIGLCQASKPVTVQFEVKNMAGIPVAQAKGRFVVTRQTGFSDWGGGRQGRIYPPYTRETTIARGEAFTDSNGILQIGFIAEVDASRLFPEAHLYFYTISVSVTDARGESHDARMTLNSGSDIRWTSAHPIFRDVSDSIPLRFEAKTMMGQPTATKARMRIYRLQSPRRVPEADPLASENIMDNPYHFTSQDQPPSVWNRLAVEKEVFNGDYLSNSPFPWPVGLGPGIYRCVLIDSTGSSSQDSLCFYQVVTDWKKQQWPRAQYLLTQIDKTVAQPGDVLRLDLAAPAGTIWAHVVIYQSDRLLFEKGISVKSPVSLPVKITEEERGGIGIRISYLRNNQFYTIEHRISIPWVNKQLDMKLEGIRSAVAPGSRQQYTLTVRSREGHKKAELVACMYDASLDLLYPHQWFLPSYPDRTGTLDFRVAGVGRQETNRIAWPPFIDTTRYDDVRIPVLDAFQIPGNEIVYMQRSAQAPMGAEYADAEPTNKASASEPQQPTIQEVAENRVFPTKMRNNLNETVFFYPELYTDTAGVARLDFTMNDALTKWRLMVFAYTRDGSYAYADQFVETRLPVMVFPYAPRFVREGDTFIFRGKVENQTDSVVTGEASLRFFNPANNAELTDLVVSGKKSAPFSIKPGSAAEVTWDIRVPAAGLSGLIWRMTAGNESYSDGEENLLPVLSGRQLVTDALPFSIASGAEEIVSFSALQKNLTPTSDDLRYVFEMTTHPVWLAVQALPSIQYQQDISSIALADKLFINQLGHQIVQDNPRIQEIFEVWQTTPAALQSPLEKNGDLKNVLLEETPWILDAQSESATRRQISSLFENNQMEYEKKELLEQVRQRQLPNGAIAWLPSFTPDVFTTQYVLEKIGHLLHLGVLQPDDEGWATIAQEAIRYLDAQMLTRYRQLQAAVKKVNGDMNANHLDGQVIQSLYVRSFFSHVTMQADAQAAADYYVTQMEKYWMSQSAYTQTLAGFVLFRKHSNAWRGIVQSLRENARHNPSLGMYWPSARWQSWNDWPVERHSLTTLLLAETGLQPGELDELHTWLLRQKQTSGWQTPKASVMAIYALLLSSDGTMPGHLLTDHAPVDITWTGLKRNQAEVTPEAGTGYLKLEWPASDVQGKQTQITLKNQGKTVAWGSLYHQYTEELSKVVREKGTALQLDGTWYKKHRTDGGIELIPCDSAQSLIPGDVLVFRMMLSADRHLEYLQLKVPHPAGCEAIDGTSGYKYQGGLAAYASVRDASTSYFLPELEKGAYIVNHEVKVTHSGLFQSGAATILCLYAPEFQSRTASTAMLTK